MPVETPCQWKEVREQLRNIVELEFANYLNNPVALAHNQCALKWWRENRNLYPNLARTAQKWLCVCATSTPSERVFSNCGVALTTKKVEWILFKEPNTVQKQHEGFDFNR